MVKKIALWALLCFSALVRAEGGYITGATGTES